MNDFSITDDELATAVRDSVASVHMTIPAEQIATRGRKIRTRRRAPLVTGALAGVAAVALAATTMLSPGHQPSHPVAARLAAWTVVSEANGDIQVTINDLSDAAGLQSRLRAEGLPVTVSFDTKPVPLKQFLAGDPVNPNCQQFKADITVQRKVVEFYPGLDDSGNWSVEQTTPALLIHPSALPDGAGLEIVAFPEPKGAWRHVDNFVPLMTNLVQKSQECTG